MKIIPLTSARSAINRLANEMVDGVSMPRDENAGHTLSNRKSAAANGCTRPQTQTASSCSEDPLLDGLLATAAGAGVDCLPGPAKTTKGTLMVYCQKGRGWCETEGIRFEIVPGNLLILTPGSRISWGTYEACPWRIAWVQAIGSNLDFFLRELGASRQKPMLDIGEDPQLLALFQEIVETLAEPCDRPRLIYAAQTLGHLFGLLIWHTKNVEHIKPDLNRRVELSINYMQQHLAKPLHVATLAGLINISPSYYAVLFKRQTGYSPIDYFIRLRMKHACSLLESTSLHVKEIAASLGYDDPFYFSRVFRTVVRNSPSEYRRSRRKEEAKMMLRQPVSINARCSANGSKC